MQFILYGYGTGWLWYYWPILALQSFGSFMFIYGLRFKKSAWETLYVVQLWNVMMSASVYGEVFIPILGCLLDRFLYLVPFEKPLVHFAWIFFMVRDKQMLACIIAHMFHCHTVVWRYFATRNHSASYML
jgi:hypothetical protein